MEEREIQFRKALSMNKNNPVAKKYIEEIRKTQDLLEDRELADLDIEERLLFFLRKIHKKQQLKEA